MHKTELKTALDETGSVVDSNPSWAMKGKDIAMMDRLFKEALWMVDTVLNTSRRPEIFERVFRDHRYQYAVLSVLGWARQLLVSLIERECMFAVRPIFQSRPLKIVMVERSHPNDQYCMATIISKKHTIYLFENLCVNGMDELGTKLPQAVAYSYRDASEDMMWTRAALILHELVHYVSFLMKVEFREITGCRRAQRRIDAKEGICIMDCQAIEFFFKKSASDRAIVEWFKERRRTRRGAKTLHGAAYGIDAVERLAKLEDGACASLLNADSYNEYVIASCVEYLKERYADRPSPELNALMEKTSTGEDRGGGLKDV